MKSLQLTMNPLSLPQGPSGIALQLKRSIIQPGAGRANLRWETQCLPPICHPSVDIASGIKISGEAELALKGTW